MESVGIYLLVKLDKQIQTNNLQNHIDIRQMTYSPIKLIFLRSFSRFSLTYFANAERNDYCVIPVQLDPQ